MSCLKIGDNVEIINYGHRIFRRIKPAGWVDIKPYLVGMKMIVTGVLHGEYSLNNEDGTCPMSWFKDEQLKKIS